MPLAEAPAAPTNLRAEAPSSEYVKISWNEPRARSGATIIGYSLEHSRDGVTWTRDPYCQFPYCDQQYLGHGRHPQGTNSIMTRIGEDATLYYRIRTFFHTNTPTIVNDIDFSRGASPSSPTITVTTVGATGTLALPTIGVTGGHGREGANDVIVFDLWITGRQQRTTPVTVIYRTVDLRARAGSDYSTRSGLLTFAPTDTEKTVSVPIIDDAVEDSGEEFILRLSYASGALIARAGAFGTITNTEESLTGFTLVDAATETDIGGVDDGDTVTLDDPADGQYGIRVETAPETGVNSVRLELSGAKTIIRTDNDAPYTLYANGGEGLPPGAYTLQATAYPKADRGGNALQSISVSFTVAEATEEAEDEPSLTATFPVSPFQSTRHRGDGDRPQVIATFSLPVKPFEKTTPSVSLTGATVRSVSQHQEEGLENAWIFFLDPEDNEDIVFTLAAGQSCDAGGICTQDGATLSQGVARTLPGPQPEQEEQNNAATGLATIGGTPQVGERLTADTSAIEDADGLTNATFEYQWTAGGSDISGATGSSHLLTASEQGQTIQVRVTFTDDRNNTETLTSEATVEVTAIPAPLTASFLAAPSSHDGDNSFTFELRLSEEVDLSYVTLRDQNALSVTDGEVTGASRLDQPGNLRWQIVVEPDSGADVTIVLPPTTDCGAQGAICTWGGKKLSGRVELTVNGPEQQSQERQNNSAIGAPTISRTPQVGETLTADVSGIDDADGLTNVSYRYQWVARGSDIDGATGSSHLLTASEQGQTIQVKVTFTDDADNQESLTSAETLAVAARPNTAATGEPTISGTPQVRETLTADTSTISDEDGLANVSYQYQWLRDDADIAGQTNSTYRLVSADEGKTIRVQVSFTDDAGNNETLTSAATTAVAARPTPAVLLTASFANVPADHNGSNFTFQLIFSENVEAGYARIRDHAFTVTGATIDSASRITQGSNQGWNVEVNPIGNGEVTITLPETTDCNAARAICTDDERKLSHATSEIVAGPPAISVSDAAVQEAEGAVLVFTVTLSRVSSRTVTVSYATQDGTATAGSDYTAASGAITFNAGDMSQTVEVTVLTDSDDEGQETLTLTLSNPSSATLADATGTGTIENGESPSGTQEDPPAVLLTATFSNMPATHNGSAFTFDLSFSENVEAGYARIRDDAFNVTGGEITSAVRKTQGSNQNWTITVKPDGNGTITITLPETTGCGATGAICTEDGRMLSNRLVVTVSGPGG